MKRVLAILCVLACLCALCVPAMATEETVTIHAYVPSDWTQAWLYVWTGEGEGAAPAFDWPGLPMTSEGDSWFSAEIPGDMTYAIVTDNNGKQTADLEIFAGVEQWITMAGDLSAEVWYEEPTADQLPNNEPGAKPEGDYVIHVDAPDAWTTAYVWAWDDTQANAFEDAGWPGLAMTKEDDGSYTANVPVWCNHLLIASNGEGPKTIDLTIADTSKEQWILVDEEGSNNVHSALVGEDGYPAEVADITVHAMVPADWANVRVWAWKDSTNLATQGWPGELVMTRDDDGWYTLTIAGWVTGLLINADGADGSVVQTGDITDFTAGSEIWIDAVTDAGVPSVSTTKPDIEAPTMPDPTEPPATNVPATQAPTNAAEDNAEQPKDNSVVIIIVFVVVAVAAIGGALLYKKKK